MKRVIFLNPCQLLPHIQEDDLFDSPPYYPTPFTPSANVTSNFCSATDKLSTSMVLFVLL